MSCNIASLIPIHLHLWKLSDHDQLRISTLLHNHAIKTLLEKRHAPASESHWLSLEYITFKQQAKIKSSINDANNHLNGIFPSFDSFNDKFCLRLRLIDSFSSCFLFHKANCCSNKSKRAYCNKLNELTFNILNEPNIVIVVLDTSIKDNIATSIAHVHSFNNHLKKMLHHAINITSTEAKLFALRCGINQAIQITDSFCIIVITDALHMVEKIFNSSIHPYQLQMIAISKELWEFLNKHLNNSIEFWNCSSNENWHFYALVDKETKKFDLTTIYLCKMSWNFNKKEKNNNIIKK